MDLLFFRIRNFRSIIDSGWQRFSIDGVTVLIGQNESGKTAVLDALARTLSRVALTENDCRVGADDPIISLRLRTAFDEIKSKLADWGSSQVTALQKYLLDHDGVLELEFTWRRRERNGEAIFDGEIDVAEPLLAMALEGSHNKEMAWAGLGRLVGEFTRMADDGRRPPTPPQTAERKTTGDLAEILMEVGPTAYLFDPDRNSLPNEVDIDDNGRLIGSGRATAQNYLKAANIILEDLLLARGPSRKAILAAGEKKVNQRLREFFETDDNAIPVPRLQCRLEFRTDGDETGRTSRYLSFEAADGDMDFYPVQRSRGVRWFVSLFLLLTSSESRATGRLLLLDEPGAWLHIRAQANLLRLLNSTKQNVRIVYTTHSPQLIEYEKLYRVLAVQRMDEQPEKPTRLIDAAHLGSATSDTLSPLFAAIGADLSHQQHVQKKNNVLLEEISGFYYVSAFWQLAKCTHPAYFLAATGADKLLQLSFLMCGWGLDFVVAMDDDKKGRELRSKLGQALYGGDEGTINANVILNTGCAGIEDVFSPSDFAKFVLRGDQSPTNAANSDYVKQLKLSKPLLASQFLNAVRKGELAIEGLDTDTRRRVRELVGRIEQALRRR